MKTQAALNMKQLGFAPELSFAKSGLSNDPISDVETSQKYIDMMWVSPNTRVLDENRVETDSVDVNGGGTNDGNSENASSQSNVNAV